MKKKQPISKAELISVYEFAKRKNVTAPAVYHRLNIDIRCVLIGARKFIDWLKYKDIEFPNAERFKKSEAEEVPAEAII